MPTDFLTEQCKRDTKNYMMKHQASDRAYVTVDPTICHGKPIISGTRVMVWQILEMLESGASPKTVHEALPTLPRGAVETALAWAAQKAKSERYIPFPRDDQRTFVSA